MRIFGIPLWPEQASSLAGQIDALYIFLILVCVLVCGAITIAIFTFIVKFRRRSEDEAAPKPIHGHLGLEIGGAVIITAIFVVIFFWSAHLFMLQMRPPDDAVELFVVGKQWMWKIQHPGGQREINELHVPVGQKVKLWMTSEDVIHSFYVPAFRMKMDVVPGRYTSTWFEATKVGTYYLFCAEYCGTEHSLMGGKVIVMEPADYQKWLTSGPAMPTALDEGEALMNKYACLTCHGAGRAPSFVGVYNSSVTLADGSTVKADNAYIRESIYEPNAKIVAGYEPLMPTYHGQLNEDQIMKIIAYLKKIETSPGAAQSTEGTPAK